MGCCVGTMKNINLKHEVFVKPEKIENKQEIDIRNPNSKNFIGPNPQSPIPIFNSFLILVKSSNNKKYIY